MTDLWSKGFTPGALIAGPTRESSRQPGECRIAKSLESLLQKTLARLGRFYSIEMAALVRYFDERDNLHITHIYKDHAWHTGLTLIIRNTISTMYQVLAQGFPVADNYPRQISTNIIERKILLSETTRSVLIIPLIYDGRKLGVLTLSSPDEGAFGTYLDGVGEGIVADLATYLNTATYAPRLT